MSAEQNALNLCSTAEVAPGAALKVEIDDLALAVFNVDGQFYVTDDACTHGPGSLSEGYIEDDVVECNFHNGQFNIRTGEVVSPPCMVPVKTYPVDGRRRQSDDRSVRRCARLSGQKAHVKLTSCGFGETQERFGAWQRLPAFQSSDRGLARPHARRRVRIGTIRHASEP